MIFVGLNHQTASVELREKLALPDHETPSFLRRICNLEGVEQAFILGTCNRVEVYAVAHSGADQHKVSQSIRELLIHRGGEEVTPCLVSHVGKDALRHLFRVASSLASLVVGEPQILGQLKRAVQQAQEVGALGRELGELTQHAFLLAKRIRTETQIGFGQASVPTAAVRLARQIFGNLNGRQVVLVGAGDMAQAAAKVLVNAGANLVIVNRSIERAERLRGHVGGEIASWEQLERTLVQADIVLSSTACPAVILTRSMLERVKAQRRGRSLFLIDIAVPRDVDPAVNELEGMYVYDVDDLSRIVEEYRELREEAAKLAESMVGEEVARIMNRKHEIDMTPVIRALRDRTREVLEAELERSLKGRLRDVSVAEREALEAMIRSATNKLMHEPTLRLKAMAAAPEAREQAAMVCDLFGLEAQEPCVVQESSSIVDKQISRSLHREGSELGAWTSLTWEFAR